MRTFVVWIGGIVATVIGGVLIHHFITPAAPNTFEGMVIDGAQSAPIKEAMVLFEIEPSSPGNGPYHDFTDENGSYKIDISQLPGTVKVTVRAQAKGFRDSKPVSLASLQADNRTDFVLEPASSGGTSHPAAAPAATPAVAHIALRYVPKALSQKITFQSARK